MDEKHCYVTYRGFTLKQNLRKTLLHENDVIEREDCIRYFRYFWSHLWI